MSSVISDLLHATSQTALSTKHPVPGTGPYKTQRRVENEIWVMERNRNY
jgi:ABC-type oligopeptide transport system substrate-binding subunit